MIKQQTTKLTITLSVIIVIMVAAAITPIKSPVFAQSTSTTNTSTDSGSDSVKTLRIGYFPNINHAQAVIGFGNGDFQKALGKNVNIQTTIFNAGPSAIEALLAKKIDVTYVGSNPAILRLKPGTTITLFAPIESCALFGLSKIGNTQIQFVTQIAPSSTERQYRVTQVIL